MPPLQGLDILKELLTEAWGYILPVLEFIWPFVAFVFLVIILRSTWLFWRQSIFEHTIPFVLLELRIPREVRKSPKAMEQVLMAFHSLRNVATDLQEK